MLTVVITGAAGYVGQPLCTALAARGCRVRRVIRKQHPHAAHRMQDHQELSEICIGDIAGEVEWAPILEGVDAVVHLASPTLAQGADDSLSIFRNVNVEGTRRLARSAAAAGVRRFVFVSTLKVHGERSIERPIREDDPLQPADAYAISKMEAEHALRDISQETGLNVITLRPPAVYGPDARGNILRLLQMISRGVPLPLASIENQRSLIFMGNLVDAIATCIEAAPHANGAYLVSDNEDVSTPGLIRGLAAALGAPPRLFPCPVALLKLGGTLMGRSGDVGRLADSLQIDGSKIRNGLGWKPPCSLAYGLEDTARWYREQAMTRR